MIRKEIYVYSDAYNLLRSIMYDAGNTFERKPIRLSLQATRQHLRNFHTKWVNKPRNRVKIIYRTMLEKIADSYEKRRVGRVEPRVRKRRPLILPINARTSLCSSGKNEIRLKSFAAQRSPDNLAAFSFSHIYLNN